MLFVEIDRGGFGVQRHGTPNGAPALTAKRYLADELRNLEKVQLDFEKLREELESETNEDDDEVRAYAKAT